MDAPSKINGNDSIKLCLYEDPQVTPTEHILDFMLRILDDIMQKCKEFGVEVFIQ